MGERENVVYIVRWYEKDMYIYTDSPIFKNEESAVKYAENNFDYQEFLIKNKKINKNDLNYKVERVVLK